MFEPGEKVSRIVAYLPIRSLAVFRTCSRDRAFLTNSRLRKERKKKMLNDVMQIGLVQQQRRRRVIVIGFDPFPEMKLRLERHVPESSASVPLAKPHPDRKPEAYATFGIPCRSRRSLSSLLAMFYKRDALPALKVGPDVMKLWSPNRDG
jgi:hypothetical protein